MASSAQRSPTTEHQAPDACLSAGGDEVERALSGVARAGPVGTAALAGLDVDGLGVDALDRNGTGVRDRLLGRGQRAPADVVGEHDAVRAVGRGADDADARSAAAAVELAVGRDVREAA